MNNALKSALLSALIFPGVGHFVLKKPIQGLILTVTSIFSLYLLFTSLSEIAEQLRIQIQNSGAIPTLQELSYQLSSQGLGTPSLIVSICWIVGIIDAYRIGQTQDKNKYNELS